MFQFVRRCSFAEWHLCHAPPQAAGVDVSAHLSEKWPVLFMLHVLRLVVALHSNAVQVMEKPFSAVGL